MVIGLDETKWPAVRAEFERTGLVRIEDGWLRPHPMLDTYAADSRHASVATSPANGNSNRILTRGSWLG